MTIHWTFFTYNILLCKYYMCLRKLRKYLGAPALNDGSRAHQTVRNANSLRCVRLWVRAGAGKDQRGMGIGWIFFRTWQTFHKWWMHIWKLRKYLRVPTIIHGSHTHQSVRNAKSTRGYDAGKDQRGMMGIDWIIFTRHKRFVDDICTYGSFENIYACLQVVAVRTNEFATPSLRVGTMLVRISEVSREYTEFLSHVTNIS